MQVDISHLECKKCGHKWLPRKADVRICPSCKTAYWDVDRKKVDEKQDK